MRKLLLVAAVLLFIGTACRLVSEIVGVKDTPVELDVQHTPVEMDIKPTNTVADIQVTKTTHSLSPLSTFTPSTILISPTPGSQPSDSGLGQIRGVLINKNSGKPLTDRPRLWVDAKEGQTEAELARFKKLFNKIELEIDDQGWFLFKDVPPGPYLIFTEKHGIVTSEFFVEAGQTTDLGEIRLPK
jgi:hypothetical protein